jgi:HAD superfamily phosphatase (TIGR01668 family)
MKLLQPWLKADRLSAIDLNMLKRQKIDTLLIDMDNTLVRWHTFDVDEATLAWLDRAKDCGFKICVLSNNRKWRIVKIMRILGVQGVWSACKPFAPGYLRAMKAVKAHKRACVFVGDQLFTDIFGANILKMRTILVNPLSPREYVWTRLMRWFERLLAGRSLDWHAEEHGE